VAPVVKRNGHGVVPKITPVKTEHHQGGIMTRINAIHILTTASVVAFAAAGTAAYAQNPGKTPTATAADDQEIIVTARRTEERLQDVPISITVFNQEQLSNRNIYNAGDLATYTPSLSTNSRFGPEKSSFAIRGFTQEGATSPSVGVYFADVVAPRSRGGTTAGNGAGVGSFFDLQSVQVLKGPQGTLFGRNTTGGAILLVPRKPTDRLEGYAELSAGNYNMLRTEAAFNVPLTSWLRVRAGVDWQQRDGYLKNHSGIGPKDMANTDYVALRLSVVADLTSNLENYTIASYSNSDTNGTVFRLTVCNRARANFTTGLLTQLGCNQIDRQNARGDGFWDVENNDADPFMRFKQWQVINTTTWQASNSLKIKNIFSYAEFREQSSFSLNGENLILPIIVPGLSLPGIQLHPGVSGYNSAESSMVEELQVQGTAIDGRLKYQAGAYLEVSKPLGFSSGLTNILLACVDVSTYQCINPLGAGTISGANTKGTFNSKGLYAQATFDLTKKLSLTGGIRYTIDKMKDVAENLSIRIPAPNTPQFTCHNVLLFNSNPVTLAPLVVTSQSQCHNEISIKSKRPTWLIDVDYKPTDDILMYAKWARGYRQGGISSNSLGLEVWRPEKVDTYEVGAKTSFHGAVRGNFNIAAFYNNFTDQQIAANLLPLPAYQGRLGGAQAIVNAGKSRIWGVEVEASIRPFRGFNVDLGYAYLHTKLLEISLPPTPPVYQPIFSTAEVGGPLALSPRHHLTVTGAYTLPLSEDIGQITFSATYTYTSSNHATAPIVTPLYKIPAVNLLNLNVSWKNMFGGPIDSSFFMTNVTNEKYIVFPGASWGSFGWEGGPTNLPRMWGFRLKYRFGE
jgi:iron complex outermembrane receptor protein